MLFLPSETMVLLMRRIRYLTKGAYQNDIADIYDISQSSVSNCVRKVKTRGNKV